MSFSAVPQSSFHPPSFIHTSPPPASAMSQGIPSFPACLGSLTGFFIPRHSTAASNQHIFVSSSAVSPRRSAANPFSLRPLTLSAHPSKRESTAATRAQGSPLDPGFRALPAVGQLPLTEIESVPILKRTLIHLIANQYKKTIMHGQGLPKNQYPT